MGGCGATVSSLESLTMELGVLTSLHCAWDRVGLSRDVGALVEDSSDHHMLDYSSSELQIKHVLGSDCLRSD